MGVYVRYAWTLLMERVASHGAMQAWRNAAIQSFPEPCPPLTTDDGCRKRNKHWFRERLLKNPRTSCAADTSRGTVRIPSATITRTPR
jgi:hypothetical protein